MAILDHRDFILDNTRLLSPPLAPELHLHLADEAVPLWLKTEEELQEIGLPPPFWAFAWAGGQALARYVLDHPEIVAGRSVLDFACGSGLVGVAAAKAGAGRVEACDTDGFALAAVALNAEANRVDISARHENLLGTDDGWEVVLAGDVCYERDMAAAVMDWLERLARRGAVTLIGDPRRAYLPHERLEALGEYGVPVTRDLEDCEIKRTGVYRFRRERLLTETDTAPE